MEVCFAHVLLAYYQLDGIALEFYSLLLAYFINNNKVESICGKCWLKDGYRYTKSTIYHKNGVTNKSSQTSVLRVPKVTFGLLTMVPCKTVIKNTRLSMW